MPKKITIVPIGQNSVEVCCEGGACVVIGLQPRPGASSSPPASPSPPEEEEDGDRPGYLDPGINGIMPFISSHQNTALLTTLETWEKCAEFLDGARDSWQHLERFGVSTLAFVVRGGRIDVRTIRDAFSGVPDGIEIIVGLMSN